MARKTEIEEAYDRFSSPLKIPVPDDHKWDPDAPIEAKCYKLAADMAYAPTVSEKWTEFRKAVQYIARYNPKRALRICINASYMHGNAIEWGAFLDLARPILKNVSVEKGLHEGIAFMAAVEVLEIKRRGSSDAELCKEMAFHLGRMQRAKAAGFSQFAEALLKEIDDDPKLGKKASALVDALRPFAPGRGVRERNAQAARP